MKILYINAMGPTERMPLGGIFVSQRIRALKMLGVEIIPFNMTIVYSRAVKVLLNLKRSGSIREDRLITNQLEVIYDIAVAEMGLLDIIKTKKNGYRYMSILERDIYGKLDHYKEVDLVHLHWCWPFCLIASKFARERDIPYVLTFHGSDINTYLRNMEIKPVLLRIMEDAASVEFISEFLLRVAINEGYSGKNAIVIYNGIDTNIFFENRLPREKKYVGFVGNLVPVKGADRLPDVFSKIKGMYSDEVRFVIVGTGILLEKIRDSSEDLHILFTGLLTPEKLAEVYNCLDLLIVPSRSEGYSCVIKEAQACGVKVVANDVGGIREAVGKYGLVVHAETEEELIDILAKKAVDCLEQKEKIDIEQMVLDAKCCSWVERQKKSLENYKNILKIE